LVPLEETMSAMEELADEGKIRLIGVSNFLVGELSRAQSDLSRHRIFSNQVRYSLIDRTIEDRLLDYCQQNHIAVIAFTPLGHGLEQISRMDPTGVLERIAKQCGKTRAQVALNWWLAKEGVVTIPKASTIERVAENCGASGWRLTAEQLRELSHAIRYKRRGTLEIALRAIVRYVFLRLACEPA